MSVSDSSISVECLRELNADVFNDTPFISIYYSQMSCETADTDSSLALTVVPMRKVHGQLLSCIFLLSKPT